MRIKLLLITVVLLAIASCKKKPTPLETYDRATLLKNIADNVIVSSYDSVNKAAAALQTAAAIFTANPNPANLDALKLAWQAALTHWMYCEAFNIEYSKANSTDAQIGAIPSKFALIETEIHGTEVINETYVAGAGTTRKGLGAVEYLIYGSNVTQQQVLDSFTGSAFAQRRKQYLEAVCADIKTKTQAVYTSWNGNESYTNFTTQIQLDISGSLNLLVNALIENIEFVRRGKIGKPAAIEASSNIDPSLCEYTLSESSLQNIRLNIASWKAIFTAKGGVGLDDYLDHVGAQYNGAQLSTTIAQQFDICLVKANEITLPLHIAIQQQPAQVAALHLELKKLTVLTKVDLASNLGVTLTFSDNDGD